jgi:5-methylcytosine-specific restriction endonuclease McrA
MTDAVPVGFCRCGCGQQTPLAKKTERAKGRVKGQPLAFLRGHPKRIGAKPACVRKAEGLARLREWNAGNPERCAEYRRRWGDENPDRRKAKYKRYRIRHSEKATLDRALRRARKKAADGHVSANIIETLMRRQRGKCVVCRVSLKDSGHHLDHLHALANGGMHEDANLQLLCPPCNLAKGARDPIEFMQSRGFLL